MLQAIKNNWPVESALCAVKLKSGEFILGYLVDTDKRTVIKQYGVNKHFSPEVDVDSYQYILNEHGGFSNVKTKTTIEEL
jgi:hypothetical protein